jgi:hypothetical protein
VFVIKVSKAMLARFWFALVNQHAVVAVHVLSLMEKQCLAAFVTTVLLARLANSALLDILVPVVKHVN